MNELVDYNLILGGGAWAQVSDAQIPLYKCPSDDTRGRALSFYWAGTFFARSNYVMGFGSDSYSPDPKFVQNSDCQTPGACDHDTDGAFRVGEARKQSSFLDGTAYMVMMSELIAGRCDSQPDCGEFDLRGCWA